jgi:DMSO/TMAO reductase YedYZ molybdopterin-dependent catalytic subunit
MIRTAHRWRCPQLNGERIVSEDRLPPGQYVPRGWPVLHYGSVPKFRPERWDFRVFGAIASERVFSWDEFTALPAVDVTADFHCVTKFTTLENHWSGIPTSAILAAAPPDPATTDVLVWGEYGYSANMRLRDFADAAALFATHHNGEPLTPDHGYPVRLVVPHLYAWKGPKWARGVEYLIGDRRGFWEERGYHNRADPWTEQRFSYQEGPDDGPQI